MKKSQLHLLQQHYSNQPTQPIPIITVRWETSQERFARLKRTADATGRRLIHVYLEDEKRQGNDQR
jgi:hypothetical protein